MKKIIKSQFFVLLGGTLFAWGNFTVELLAWLRDTGSEVGCTPGVTNPFLTPCFFGAIFFTVAFTLSALLLKKLDMGDRA